MNPIKGTGVVLYIKDSGVYYPVACSKDVTINTTANLIQTAPKTSGQWKTYEYGVLEGEISGSGLSTLYPSSNRGFFDLQTLQFAKTKIVARLVITDVVGASVVYDYAVVVNNISVQANSIGFATFNYNLKITGQVVPTYAPGDGLIDADGTYLTDSDGIYLIDGTSSGTMTDFTTGDFVITDFI